ncbi:MAG: S8 family serine peptidase [Gemmatimonadaceae bacterium]
MLRRHQGLLLFTAMFVAACSTDNVIAPVKTLRASKSVVAAPATGRYLVLMKGNGIGKDFAARVASLGGTVRFAHEGAGVASVAGLTASAAATLARFSDVAELQSAAAVRLSSPLGNVVQDVADMGAPSILSQDNPTTGVRYIWQWNMRLINAPAAWAAGKLGSSSVKVAIIDTGLDYDIRDLNGLVDLAHSVSYTDECVPDPLDEGEEDKNDPKTKECEGSLNVLSDNDIAAKYFAARNKISDFNGHGTNVGTQVSSKAFAFAGVTSKTTLMGIKVLGANGSGWTDDILRGLLYAADNGADVANMSLGGDFSKAGGGRFVGFLNRVFNYVQKKGMLVVVAAGNSESDLQHNGNTYNAYCDAAHVLCVSAVGPATPTGNGNTAAFFSNFGRSAVGVAAPGGNASFDKDGKIVVSAWPWGNDIASWVWSFCTKTLITAYNADGSPIPTVCAGGGRLTGYIGTSQASPHVAGLAALLIAENGKGQPQTIKHLIEQSAASTVDRAFGRGVIDVKAALGL